MITSRIMLVMPARAVSGPNTTSRPPKKPSAAVIASNGSNWSPSRKPASDARPAASAFSSNCRRRWRYGPGWSENIVFERAAGHCQADRLMPVAMPIASGNTTAAVLHAATRHGTFGRLT
ncbi:hypothetical protein [Rhodanobacter lindaniclasticus]